jgi:two-component system LytT family response regulator
VDDGIAVIQKYNPDLIFLDIEIGEQTGFDLLNSLEVLNFAVIFTTAFNQYAIEAFKFNAVHYILKPINKNDLTDAVKRVSVKKNDIEKAVDNVKALLHQIEGPHSRKVALHTEEGIKYIASNDIIHLKADGSYSVVYIVDGRSYIVSKLLKEFESELDNRIFYRIGKSHIVNLNHVRMFKRIDGGTVEMIDGTHITIPRRKREDFIRAMNRFIS